jgi:hypothetical protein
LKFLKHLTLTVSAGLIAVCVGCDHGLFPKAVSLSDPEIAPLLKAMETIDRAALGFTAITTNSQIKLELSSPGGAYDAMLHIYSGTSRTIAFRKTASGYRWISEQEIHQGPKWYQTVDGTFQEYIVVEYQTERVNGVPTNQLYIQYTGNDTNLASRELTLAEVRPIFDKWERTPAEPRPPDLPGAGFDPAPAMFVLFMLIALIAACVLAVILGIVGIVIAAAMIGAGVISASVLTGFLRRSISSGFQALFIQVGALAGLTVGLLAVMSYTWVARTNLHSPHHWIAGAGLGLLAGISVAWLFNKAWTSVAEPLAHKFERTRK